jgi:NAD(P)-dependent dehydrogenase (short-subunit alcohol dehydrogenase family)
MDLVVNNAGISIVKPPLDLDEAGWDAVVDTNLRGAWLVAQAAARALVAAGQPGRIVNVASIVGLRPIGHLAPYAAAKAGLIHLTRVLAMEWARHGIQVNAIAPGYVETDLNREFWDSPAGKR